jgi:biopolymer transport protein ExbD
MKLISHIQQAGPSLYLAPMLNTVLLLLVFFFLGSSFMVQSGVPVVLPTSPSRLVGFDRADIITVPAGAEGQVYYNGVAMPIADLPNALYQGRSTSRRVMIYADARASHGWVMRVSSVALAAGLEVAVGTSAESQP